MRFAILTGPGSWYTADLLRAAAGRHEVSTVAFADLACRAGGAARLDCAKRGAPTASGSVAAGASDLSQFHAVLVRAMPPGTLEQVVFRMDALAELERAGCAVVNPPKALETAVDKYLALARLEAAGLRVPRTWVGQSADSAIEAYRALGGDVVVKPLFGSEGRGLLRVDTPELAWRVFTTLTRLGAVLYLQEFVPHDEGDFRVLLVGRRGWAIRRTNPADWRTNVSRGARAEAWELDAPLAETARRAAAAVGCSLAGVDLLRTAEGWSVIEVNGSPGWRGVNAAHGVDVAAAVVEHLEEIASGRPRR